MYVDHMFLSILNNFKENNKPDWIKKRKKISLFIRILKPSGR